MCSICYHRARRAGEFTPKKIGQIKVCQYDECDAPHFAKGYCMACYQRLWKNGTLEGKRIRRDGCSFYECSRKHHAKGMCSVHYKMVWRMKREPLQLELPLFVEVAPLREIIEHRTRSTAVLALANEIEEDPQTLTRLLRLPRVKWHVADRIATKLGYPHLLSQLSEAA